MAEVVQMDRTVEKAQSLADGIALVERWRRILALRWLCLLALLVGCVVWTVAVSDPSLWRCVAAAGYSLLVLGPVLALYFLTHKAE